MAPVKKGNQERDGPSEGRQRNDNESTRQRKDSEGRPRKDNEGRQRRSKGGGGGSNGISRPRVVSETSDDCCSVCLFKFQIYSVGECNHPVCHVCSTRMRVLCSRNECAICRQDLPKVVFTHMLAKYETLKDNIYQMDRKYKICFEDDSIQDKYHYLLDHMCPECPEQPTFKTFRQLDLHIRKEHEMYYCDLCVINLKIFTSERKHYTRKDLVHHRRKGDVDNTSHKGHPLCEFCDTRFFDNDELFKHLRKDHYFCHFCDADGLHLYFSDYKELRAHFDKDHYLCTEEHCEHEKFTSVFRSEIDMKAHKIEQHSGGLGKAATKQNRIVDVEFNYARREPQGGREERGDRGEGRGRGRGRGGYRGDRHGTRTPEPDPDGAREPVLSAPNLAEDFPSLFEAAQEYGNSQAQGGGLASKVAMSSGHNVQQGGASWSNKGGAAPNLEEEFPGLPGAPPPSHAPPPKPYGAKPQQKQPVKQKKPTEDFPGLPLSAKQSKGSNRPQSANVQKANDFPSLGQSKPLASFSSAPSRASSAPKTSPTPQPASARHTPQRIVKDERIKDPFDDEPDFSWSSERDFVSACDPTTQGNLKLVKNTNCDTNTVRVNAANLVKSDFPGLGAPEKKLTDFIPSNSSGKNKNKNKKQNNAVSRKTVHAAPDLGEKTSLNSIASFLGADEKKEKKERSPQPQIVAQKVKEQPPAPTKSAKAAPAPEPALYTRPSKEKKSEKQEPAKHKTNPKLETEDFPSLGAPAKMVTSKAKLASEDFPTLGAPSKNKASKDVKLDNNDFPTLGGPSKKMTANFPKSENKKVAKTAATSSSKSNEWSEVKQSKGNSNGAAKTNNAPKPAPPTQKSAPVPAKVRHAPERNAKELEEDFSWSSERDFVSASDPTSQGNLKFIKSVNCDSSNSSGNIKKNVKLDKDDFPSLGGPAKKINANFVKAQDKLVKTAATNSQWSDDKLASSFKENNTPVENRQTKGSVSSVKSKAPASSEPDFPSLEAPQKSAPPGFSPKVPPGFSNGSKPATIKAPPGFSPMVLGEKNKNKTYLYHHPDNFQARNAALINTISSLLGGKSLEFQKFRELSVSFRAGSLPPSDYYKECGALVSKKEFSNFFPELVALLPDIKKQKSLQKLHNAAYPNSGLTSCSVCDQVLLEEDHTNHENSHALDQDFPALGF